MASSLFQLCDPYFSQSQNERISTQLSSFMNQTLDIEYDTGQNDTNDSTNPNMHALCALLINTTIEHFAEEIELVAWQELSPREVLGHGIELCFRIAYIIVVVCGTLLNVIVIRKMICNSKFNQNMKKYLTN